MAWAYSRSISKTVEHYLKSLSIDIDTFQVSLTFAEGEASNDTEYIGEYAGGTTYSPGDVVWYADAFWECILESTGNTPSEGTYWTAATDLNDAGQVYHAAQERTATISLSWTQFLAVLAQASLDVPPMISYFALEGVKKEQGAIYDAITALHGALLPNP